jgi:hypothetical protein
VAPRLQSTVEKVRSLPPSQREATKLTFASSSRETVVEHAPFAAVAPGNAPRRRTVPRARHRLLPLACKQASPPIPPRRRPGGMLFYRELPCPSERHDRSGLRRGANSARSHKLCVVAVPQTSFNGGRRVFMLASRISFSKWSRIKARAEAPGVCLCEAPSISQPSAPPPSNLPSSSSPLFPLSSFSCFLTSDTNLSSPTTLKSPPSRPSSTTPSLPSPRVPTSVRTCPTHSWLYAFPCHSFKPTHPFQHHASLHPPLHGLRRRRRSRLHLLLRPPQPRLRGCWFRCRRLRRCWTGHPPQRRR